MFFAFDLFFSCSFLSPGSASAEEYDYAPERREMVLSQIEARGIKDKRVLEAMLKVKRHLFVPEGMKPYAYQDSALPAEKNQTISQPYIVALMTELAQIKPQDKVLEVGTGTGYQAAVLSELTKKVFTLELIKELADKAQERLAKLGYSHIQVRCGDGYRGWPEESPFDAIIVTAAAIEIPEELIKELKPGGRMVIPLGDFFQELFVITKKEDGTFTKEQIIPVRFVPLIKQK